MYQRLPVAVSEGWYTCFCNVYIFICKERGGGEYKTKLNYFLEGRTKETQLVEIYSLYLGERF